MRDGAEGMEVLLVRTLGSKRWIIPKGWPVDGKTLGEAAAQEAWEEAGVRGALTVEPIGFFTYQKRRGGGFKQKCRVAVFEILVSDVAADYPEVGMRSRKWFSQRKAADKLREPELRALVAAHDTRPQ